MLYEYITELIGSTPIVRIPFHTDPANGIAPTARVYAKLEYLNPGGSIKDRAAYYMITEAEKRGDLQPGGTIIEASSGNQGTAAAYIGAVKGYQVIITVSEKVSKEKQATLQAYGATIIRCPATTLLTDPRSYHSVALELQRSIPNSFMLNQYFNPDNPKAHYASLGPEIWKQTDGKITHFIAAAGSGGTVSGAGRYLKEQNPSVQVIAVDATTSYYSTHGNPKPYRIEGMGIDYDTPLLHTDVIDHIMTVSDEDGLGMLKKLACNYGVLVGPPSGAVAYAGKQIARTLPEDALVVMLFGDSGRSYLTKHFFAAQEISDTKYDAPRPLNQSEMVQVHQDIQKALDATENQ